jgi:tetratricopeptide (TPR) repeat protein
MVETRRRPATVRFHHNRAGLASPAIMTAARRLAYPGTKVTHRTRHPLVWAARDYRRFREKAGGAVAGAGLRLEVRDFAGLTSWRWVLTDSGGALVAEHEVRLDSACWQFEAFTDLLGYLSWHVAPSRQRQDTDRIADELGRWIGAEVLGAISGKLAAARPGPVRVIMPDQALALAFRPLELAHAGGRPLAVQGITLIMDPGASSEGCAVPVGDRLRVLGLFSLPEGGRALNLRRERDSLVQWAHRVTAAGKAVGVRVLQYGVTRERLRDVLAEAEGWDVIHISGHGAPGELLLETAAGKPDPVSAADLADMLDLARERVKLVTVSACWSAAPTVAEHRRLLGLPAQDQHRQAEPDITSAQSGALATELVARLNCAVLAMRYPVTDDFAIALSGQLYELLGEGGYPLSRAVGIALERLAVEHPALSVTTPALFGPLAADVRLAAPPRPQPASHDVASHDAATVKMAGFPHQPERFVGRTGVMARASAALATQSGIPGVLLRGMPGGGKTACALELAYSHEHAFDGLVFYKAPDEGSAIDGALADFALTLERFIEGFQIAHLLASPDSLASVLPQLSELMSRCRLLLVIDNIESLLSPEGQWADARWGQVIGALAGHGGQGRVVLTSRREAAGLTGLRMEVVDALSPDEALLLSRDLPGLRALIRGKVPGIEPAIAKGLARRALEAAQGHPKLMELADGQVSHPDRLRLLLDAGDQAWRKQGGLPAGFFDSGESHATGDSYLHVLGTWTKVVTGTLMRTEQALFWLLCCLEEPDRQRSVVNSIWASLWDRLGEDGQPTDPGQSLVAIMACGLVAGGASDESYAIHPGASAAGRDDAGRHFQDAVDAEAAIFWAASYKGASWEEEGDRVDTRLLVRAGLAAAPYLMRQGNWNDAGFLLERAFNRYPSRANAAAVLPAVQRIIEHTPDVGGLLGSVLRVIAPAAAESHLRTFLDSVLSAGNYRAASVAAGQLFAVCMDSGRLEEALLLTGQALGYARQAGLGPWSELGEEVRRLQVLNEMGDARQVLAEVGVLRDRMNALPPAQYPAETTAPWGVREALLHVGRHAADQLEHWEDSLSFNSACVASQRDRRAPDTDIAMTRYNEYVPLLALQRRDEAVSVLLHCRQVFADARDARMLGKILTSLARIDHERGHGDAAIRLQLDALSYSFLAGDVTDIANGYHNLGILLDVHARQPAPALASHLAAALICALTGIAGTDHSIHSAKITLRAHGSAAVPPVNVADLCRRVGEIPGTDLPGLLAKLSPDPETADNALGEIIKAARRLAGRDGNPG